jgi:hypothetical protein
VPEDGGGADGYPVEEEEVFGHLKMAGDVVPGSERPVGAGDDLARPFGGVGEGLLVAAVSQ